MCDHARTQKDVHTHSDSQVSYIPQQNITFLTKTTAFIHLQDNYDKLLMKQRFVEPHTIQQTEIPAVLDSWVKTTPSVKMLWPQKIVCPYIFIKQ